MTRIRTWLLVALLTSGLAGLAQAYPLTSDATVKDAIRHGTFITPHGVWDAQ